MNKKKKILITSTTFLLLTGSILTYNTLNSPKQEQDNIQKSSLLAIYLQDDSSDTGYTLSNTSTFPTDGYTLNLTKSSCTNGGTLSQDATTKKISLSTTNQNNCTLYFDKVLTPEKTLAKLGKTAKEGNPTFASPATTDETAEGLYTMEDDYGTSYYYRGNVADNYVKFADKYWRIIRVNGDGSVRVIYDGTSAHANSDTSTDRLAMTSQAFNTLSDDAKYVGYMYGPANETEGTTASTDKDQAQTNTVSSDIKTKLEEWYVTNIKDKNLDEKVADSIFCYDRTTPGSEATGWYKDTGLGYGKNYTGYGSVARIGGLNSDKDSKPQFKCPNKNDAFTKEDTQVGNGSLSEKIGLISADEVVTAGSGKYNTTNQSYYLHKGSWYLAGSPYDYVDFASVFRVYDDSGLQYGSVDGEGGVAPVINLSAEYFNTLIGDGTIGNEFREA